MKNILKNSLLAIFLSLTLSLGAQVESILKTSFPEWYGELQITDGKKYDKSQKEKYRNLYQKFDKALSDVEGFKIGAIDKTTIQVLNYDQLKQIAKKDALDTLVSLIKADQNKINNFLKWDEKFAADSIHLATYWAVFKDNFKDNKFDEAYPHWQVLFNRYPIFHSSIYTGGQKILTFKIDKKDEKQQIYKDSLLLLFDQQMRAYPQNAAYAKGMKAYYFYKFNVENKDINDTNIRKLMVTNYEMFYDAINTGKEKTQAFLFPYCLKLSLFLAQLNKVNPKVFYVTPDKFLEDYLSFSDILTAQYNAEKDEKKKENIKKQGMDLLDNIFTQSDFSNCENLISIFTPKYQANKKNAQELKKMITLMSKKGCLESKLYEDCIISLYQVEPSAKSAQSIAQLLSFKNNFPEAAKYYDLAIESETVDSVKARYYFEAAKVYNQLNQYSKSREYAKNSIRLNPTNGKPLILIATLYAATASSVGQDDFEHSAVFWAAADKLLEAKKIDPSVTADADKLLQIYSARFPKKEEAFMHSVYEGAAYTVGGWIGETTTARFYK